MEEGMAIMAGGDGISIHAGFPNPALERRGQRQALALDLNQLLVRHPSSSYLFRVSGHNWTDEGVLDGDIALIDRAVRPRSNDLIIIWQASGFALCRRSKFTPDDQFWGVVAAIIHPLR